MPRPPFLWSLLVIDIAMSPLSLRSIAGIKHGFHSIFGRAVMTSLHSQTFALAEVLNRNVKRQFVLGTDKYGQSHNKTGFTLSTFRVESSPTGAFVIGEGGADIVETGQPAHRIDASGASPLAWEGGGFGPGMHYARSVWHPRVAPDPYVERAIAETSLDGFGVQIVSDAYAAIVQRFVI
jgi:hypothetical protein